MPEAFKEADQNPRIAYFTAIGFLVAFVISAI